MKNDVPCWMSRKVWLPPADRLPAVSAHAPAAKVTVTVPAVSAEPERVRVAGDAVGVLHAGVGERLGAAAR